MRALLAPYDKTGLIELAAGLAGLGWELIATGNTEKALREAGLPVTSVPSRFARIAIVVFVPTAATSSGVDPAITHAVRVDICEA